MPSVVAQVPPAPAPRSWPAVPPASPSRTDCWDVSAALAAGAPDFVLLDVRAPALYARRHIPGALNLPHGKMTERRMAEWPDDTLFVVYCAGPHCNGTDRAALRLATIGRRVKVMIGGMTGWADEGLDFAPGDAGPSRLDAAGRAD